MSREEKIAANRARARRNRSESGTTTPASDNAATESPKNPKSDAKSNDKLLRYPFSKLNESDDYMMIEIFDFEPLGL